MPIIKLDAIDSTNDYLKQLVQKNTLENFTVVIANEQTKGRGQMGTQWLSETGKNLIMSVLVNDLSPKTISVFDLNVAVTLAVFEVVNHFKISNLKIKWPNDIMADSKKLGGILIENTIKPNGNYTSIIGIGLNVNQIDFDFLPNATSMINCTSIPYDLEEIALMIREKLQFYLVKLDKSINEFWELYLDNLYKKNRPTAFEDANGYRFMGIILNVTRDGLLEVQKEDDSVMKYNIKQIKLLQ
jgi:BirA family biotin operon repressor/biotin-[acetyl-CoA-carboxylase] ligase